MYLFVFYILGGININNYNLAKKINKIFYYGWIIVFTSALSLFFSAPGQTYSISTFIDSYIKEFGFSRTVISSFYSTATLISGLSLIFIGRLIDKIGQKKMFLISGLMLAIACFFNSFTINITMVFIGFFICRYFGQGSLSIIPGTLVPQWFEKNRALAMSIYGFGYTIAFMLVPTINSMLIDNFGWRMTWRIWGILLICIFIPFIYVFVINNPEDIGLLPDNKTVNKEDKNLFNKESLIYNESWELKEAMKTKMFWLMGFCISIIPLISTGLVFHFVSIMQQKMILKSQAVHIMGFIGVPGFFIPILAGIILDRYKPHLIISITFAIIFIDMIFFSFVQSVQGSIIFILIYGTSMSIQGVASGVIWPNYFGRKYLGNIKGVTTVLGVIGSALGPIIFGASFDMFGSYNFAIILMTILALIGSIFSLFCSKPKKATYIKLNI